MDKNGPNIDKNCQHRSKMALNGLKLYFLEKKSFDKNGQNRTKWIKTDKKLTKMVNVG